MASLITAGVTRWP